MNIFSIRLILTATVLFFPFFVQSVNHSPWLGEMLVFDWQSSLFYQHTPAISSGKRTLDKKSEDFFLRTNLSTSALEYGIEFEAVEAFTKKQHGNLDHFSTTLKYQWWDDIAGDPLSINTGITFIQAFKASVHDIISFHHGKAEAEFYISCGKETACLEEWKRRWASTLAIGCADVGSAWLRMDGNYDFKHGAHEWGLLYRTLLGFGSHELSTHHFHGYGSVRHRSLDVGVKYAYVIDFIGKFQFAYTNRVYAKNFPCHVQIFLIEFFYDFGIDAFGF